MTTNRVSAAMSEVNLIAQLADLKEDNYQLTLALSTLMELLVERGILTHDDIVHKAEQLDTYPYK
ncbi:hypothetical protein [Paenibacillus sp. 481]|uniref:hypothetical protein n=1 Tax=Paenibacillus sp. 481 TaxID=2835869 RepID=UPI001E5B6F22|nr:hypothetical protein [Paenibacillus sp. 481]UHA75399.1 hypothetical protein KIK04_10575 [Paenibacillus sp. 481]